METINLLESDNPFTLAVLVGRSAFVGNKIRDSKERDRALLQFKIQLLRKLAAKKISSEKIRALINFLRYYVNFENSNNNTKLDKEIQSIKGSLPAGMQGVKLWG